MSALDFDASAVAPADWLATPEGGYMPMPSEVARKLSYAIVPSQTGQVTETRAADWPGLAAMVTTHETSPIKVGSGWLPARIAPGPRTADRVAGWDVLALDIEGAAEKVPGSDAKRLTGPKAPELRELAVELELRGWAGALATSHSHEAPAEGGTLGPRYRAVLPLTRALKPDEIKPVGIAVAAMLGVGDCFDSACLDPARLFFNPRVPAERQALAEHAVIDGQPLDVDALMSGARRVKVVRERKNATGSVIHAFNEQADVGQILEEHGYEPMGRNRWKWPGSTSGVAGVIKLPDSECIYSHHERDPLYDREHSRDAFDVWCVLAHAGDVRAAVKAAAQAMGMGPAHSVPPQPRGQRPPAGGIDPETGEILDGSEPLLRPISVDDVLSNPAEPPAFIWQGLLPRGVVSLLGAHGGTGKSTVALMLSVCAALGRPLFGIDTVQSNVLFVSLEDGAGVVRHRLASICRAWDIAPHELNGRLVLVDGTETPELFAAEARGAGECTPTHHELAALAQTHRVGFVVVDNASDAFGGDEINRRQVRAFMRSLARVAKTVDCAVMLLAHVAKTTSRAGKAEGGEAYSGSTAWHNSARSRLFMSRGADGGLTIEHQKSNLSKLQETIRLAWPNDELPMLAQGMAGVGNPAGEFINDLHMTAIVGLIGECYGRGEYVSTGTSSPANAFRLLHGERRFPASIRKADQLWPVLRAAERQGLIEKESYQSADRKRRERWRVSVEVAPTAPTAPTYEEGTQGARGAPTAPTGVGGVGGWRGAKDGAKDGANGAPGGEGAAA